MEHDWVSAPIHTGYICMYMGFNILPLSITVPSSITINNKYMMVIIPKHVMGKIILLSRWPDYDVFCDYDRYRMCAVAAMMAISLKPLFTKTMYFPTSNNDYRLFGQVGASRNLKKFQIIKFELAVANKTQRAEGRWM